MATQKTVSCKICKFLASSWRKRTQSGVRSRGAPESPILFQNHCKKCNRTFRIGVSWCSSYPRGFSNCRVLHVFTWFRGMSVRCLLFDVNVLHTRCSLFSQCSSCWLFRIALQSRRAKERKEQKKQKPAIFGYNFMKKCQKNINRSIKRSSVWVMSQNRRRLMPS